MKAEAAYAKDKTVPDPTSTDNPEYQIVLSIIKEVRPWITGAYESSTWKNAWGFDITP